MNKTLALCAALLVAVASPAFAAKSCDELKTTIAAKIDGKHVTGYTLEIVTADKTGERKVVGSCEGGTKRIVYTKAAK